MVVNDGFFVYLMGQKKSLMFFKKTLTFFEFLGGFFSQGLMFFFVMWIWIKNFLGV